MLKQSHFNMKKNKSKKIYVSYNQNFIDKIIFMFHVNNFEHIKCHGGRWRPAKSG